ncbi:MAG: PAS domain S-box protein [Spirochaetota bacterium]|nr:PAS domain S-box protein [Spirochaetota bacterium]
MMGKPKILIVEDTQTAVTFIRQAIEKRGWEIVGILDPSETAVKIVENERPDIILVDIKFNDNIDGIPLPDIIYSSFDIPIIFITSNADIEIQNRAIETGSYEYLTKPFKECELYSVIEVALYKHELEMRLINSENEYRRLIEQLPYGLAIFQGASPCITFVNTAFANVLGYAIHELLSPEHSSVEALISPEDITAFLQHYQNIISEQMQSQKHFESRFIMKDKTVRIVGMNANRIEYHGEPAVNAVFIDTTIHNQSDNISQEMENAYSTFFKASTDGILIADIKTKKFQYANSSICKMLGYSDEEILGMVVIDIHPGESREYVISEFEAQARGDKTLAENIPLLTKDNKVIYADINATTDNFYGRECIIGFFREVTIRKGVEEYLRRYAIVLETMIDGITITDMQGKIIYINSAAAEQTGYSREEVIGKTPADIFISEQHKDKFYKEISNLLSGKPIETSEYILKHKEGREFPTSINITVIGDINGNPKEIVAVHRDITNSKKLENSLLAEKKFTENALNTLTDIFYVFDFNGKPVRWNKRFNEATGFSDEEITVRVPTDFFKQEDAQRVAEAIKLLQMGESVVIRADLVTKDMQRIAYELSGGYHKNSDGEIIGICGIGRDITERKKAEEKIEELLHDYGERIKELNCLYSLSKLEDHPNITIEEILYNIVNLLSQSWQYSGITCARIIYKDKEYKTDNYNKTEWILSADIIMHRKIMGVVEVCYLEEKPDIYEGPFTKEERNLIDEIAERLSRIIDRKWSSNVLQDSLERFYQSQIEVNGLLQASKYIMHGESFEYTIECIFDTCKGLIGAAVGYVVLKNESIDVNEILFMDSGEGPYSMDDDLQMPLIGLQDIAFHTKKTFIDNNLYSCRLSTDMPEGYMELNNILFAPISDQERVLGLIALANKAGGFSEGDIQMATAFGELASISLINSRYLKKLEESEQRFRTVAQTASDAIITADSNGMIVFLNNTAITMFGYSFDEIISKSIAMLLPASFNDANGNDIHRILSILKSNSDKTIELSGLRKGGIEFPLELSLASWETDEKSFVTAIMRDITERKQAEEKLRKYQDNLEELVDERTDELIRAKEMAESANRAKSAFLANMSHELRTPLNSILGFSKLMRLGYEPEDYDIHLDNIVASGEYLLSLINDILNLAKIESGKIEFNMKPNLIHDIIKSCIQLIQPQAEKKGIELHYSTESEGAKVYGDEKWLKQIFLNLFNNAVKFTDQGGSVKIITIERMGTLMAKIIDTGIGIKLKDQKHIFEKFSQVNSESMLRGLEGTGLGLSITKELIEAHSGEILVDSEFGKGSTFTVLLPCVRSLSVVKASAPDESKEKRALTQKREEYILIVDDQKENRDLLSAYFKRCGQKCLTAESGEESVKIMKEYKDIALILMDIKMRGMSGTEAMKSIKSSHNVPIMAITAHAMEGDQEKLIDEGFDEYIAKPVNIDTLGYKIDKLLNCC